MDQTEGTTTPDAGPAAQGPETATLAAPSTEAGQPQASTTGTTADAEPTEDTFFDPRDIADSPELMKAYKQMQGAFTKKLQGVSANRKKIDEYDAFMRDPLSQIQTMASRMGYKLTRAEAQAMADQQQSQGVGSDWEPQTWDEVLAKAEERAEQRIMAKFAPMQQEFQTMRRTKIENQLAEIDPTWQQYEDKMVQVLRAHPTLQSDPVTLYRLAVPPEVMESRATQAALRKLQAKVDGGKLSGASTAKAKPVAPDRPLTFPEAVAFAKNQLAEQGIRK